MTNANDRQVGGDHYKKHGNKQIQHWDLAAARNYDYFQGQITKYVDRWRDKNGIIDLEKALHFLEKYIEVEKAKLEAAKKSEPLERKYMPSKIVDGKLMQITVTSGGPVAGILRNDTINHPAPFGFNKEDEVD